MKIAVIVGHNQAAQGAIRVTDRRTEYDWNSELAQIIADLGGDQIKIIHRRPGAGEIADAYLAADNWGAQRTVELHFNAFTDPSAGGCETLYAETSVQGKQLARSVQTAMQSALGNRDRGLKATPPSGRGGRSLHAGRAPAVLVEPYFGSNPQECVLADAKMTDLAEAILIGCGGEVRGVVDQPDPFVVKMEAAMRLIQEAMALR